MNRTWLWVVCGWALAAGGVSAQEFSDLTGRVAVGGAMGLTTAFDVDEEALVLGIHATSWFSDIWSLEGSVATWSDAPYLSRFPKAELDVTTVAFTLRARASNDLGIEPYAGLGAAYHFVSGKRGHRFDDGYGFHVATGLETAWFDPWHLFLDARVQFLDLDGRFEGEKYSTSYTHLLLRLGASWMF